MFMELLVSLCMQLNCNEGTTGSVQCKRTMDLNFLCWILHYIQYVFVDIGVSQMCSLISTWFPIYMLRAFSKSPLPE